MSLKLTHIFSVIMVIIGLLVFSWLAISPVVLADTKSDITGGITEANGGKAANPDTTQNNLINQIVNIFSTIVGAVAVIMIIYGGFRYITSGGDSNAVATARKTITYAVIGIIVVVLAQVIVRVVIGETFKATK